MTPDERAAAAEAAVFGPRPVRILIAGDTHGDRAHIRYLVKEAHRLGCDRIVQVGDFGYWPHKDCFDAFVQAQAVGSDIQFYWLDGNHENFDALAHVVDVNAAVPQPMGSHVTYLPRGCTWTWGDVKFMALGGAYSIDKDYRVKGVSWWPQELLTAAQVERAMDRGPVDVLLCHDAPDGVCPIVDDDYKGDDISRGNRKAVTAVMEAVKPTLLIHGHYHYAYSQRLGEVSIHGLGRDGDGRNSYLVLDTAELRGDD